jgi:hypothetical protein
MKKILFFLLLFYLIPGSLLAINGLGTFASPYHGTITADTVWNTGSAKIYVNGDITVTAHLTINSGLTIVFVSAGADLIITGNGVLTASGGSGANMIRFTADYDNDSNYGETGETWGHISFQDMNSGFTTPSIINYCIIEFGYKDSSPWGFESSGGGIQTAYTYLTISNSIVRNNYAGWGGGIYVNANTSPSILNCEVSNNTAGTTGGGISIYQYSAAVVTNSVIVKNTCNGGGGGGGVFVGNYPDNVRFYNCVVASNLSTTSPGNNIRIWKSAISTGPRFYNIIVWGSDNSINFLEVGSEATDFNYCAIQAYATGYTNCINLSGTNTDPAGPNFYNVTPGSEDYRINYISPCRDAGTSSGAPATDYLGKSRIGNYDIGAYEVQYSKWTGATNNLWLTNTNWDQSIDPDHGSGDVIIPSGLTNYPIGPPAKNFTIGSGKIMILNPGAKATLSTLTNNGTLKLESDASNISSLIVSTFSGNDATVELFLTGGQTVDGYIWHYISSPFTSLSTDFFTGTTNNLAQWVENLAGSDLMTGWVAYDGFIYRFDPDAGPYTGPEFSSLTSGKGYNYYFGSNHTYPLQGQLNAADIPVSLNYTLTDPDQPTRYGLNLLGNPFSSGLNWDNITNGSYYPYPTGTSKALYYNKDGRYVYYIGGVGSEPGVTGIIPPMQGFFTKTYTSGNSITFPAAARTHSGIPPRYKGETIIPLIRIKLTSNGYNDYTVVRFDNAAKSGLDLDFDAERTFISGTNPYIYTLSEGKKYAINGQPFPTPGSFVEIPIVVNVKTTGNHTIYASQLQGLDNYDVSLTDKLNNLTVYLKTSPSLSFTSVAGTFTNRFVLKVGNFLTGIEDPVVSRNTFNIYPANYYINIQTISDDWDGKKGTVRVLDLTGKTVGTMNNIEFWKNSLIQLEAPAAMGIYIVELKSGVMKYVGKVVVR